MLLKAEDRTRFGETLSGVKKITHLHPIDALMVSTVRISENVLKNFIKTTSATQDDPLNLSISISGGKDNNCDTHGNGE